MGPLILSIPAGCSDCGEGNATFNAKCGYVHISCATCGTGVIVYLQRQAKTGKPRQDAGGYKTVARVRDVRKDVVSAQEGKKVVKKRGRPKKEGPKPWEAAGISRALWYRRQKEKAAGGA